MKMTLEDIDIELARLPTTPTTDVDLNSRATLMARRIELSQGAKATAEANRQHKPIGNLIVNVPQSLGISNYYGERGRTTQSRVTEDGKVVLDLFEGEFKTLLMGRHGLEWQTANPDLLALIARG
jgi:hypothetical protein